MKILVVDQGTTSTRALHYAPESGLRPLLQRQHRQILPAPGHVEQDPEEILRHLAAALSAAPADLVALANQGESCLGWDARDGRPVSPIIVWQDNRTAPDCARLVRDGLAPEIMARAGLPPDPYFSASKLGWILQQLPQAAALARQGHLRLGTTDAFFRDRLTGRFQTDIATASRTALMNLETGQWDATLCEIFGIPIEALPEITPTAGDLGCLPSGARLTASIVDQQAALYGHGCREPGDAKITIGTGAFVQCLTAGPRRADRPGPLPTIAWQLPGEAPRHALDGAVYTAAAAVDWARSLGLFIDHDAIAEFERAPAIDRGLVFLPALAGLACPHWDRQARGAWVGMTLDSSGPDLMQALLEGVALRVAEAMAAIQPLRRLSVDGGMARNGYLLEFLAGLLPQPLHRAQETESTALGLAHMALAAEGMTPPPRPGADPVAARPGAAALAPGRMARFARIRTVLGTLATETAPLTSSASGPDFT